MQNHCGLMKYKKKIKIHADTLLEGKIGIS